MWVIWRHQWRHGESHNNNTLSQDAFMMTGTGRSTPSSSWAPVWPNARLVWNRHSLKILFLFSFFVPSHSFTVSRVWLPCRLHGAGRSYFKRGKAWKCLLGLCKQIDFEWVMMPDIWRKTAGTVFFSFFFVYLLTYTILSTTSWAFTLLELASILLANLLYKWRVVAEWKYFCTDIEVPQRYSLAQMS